MMPEGAVSVFDFDFYLFPEHRMGLAFAALWNGANAFLSRNGIRYTFSRLTRFNVASRRAHQHLGWKLVGRALFLQLGRFEMMLATLAQFVTFSVAAAQRVRLTLGPAALRCPLCWVRGGCTAGGSAAQVTSDVVTEN